MMQHRSIYSQGMNWLGSGDSERRLNMLASSYTFSPSSLPSQECSSSIDRHDYHIDTIPVRIAQQEQEMMMGGGSMGMDFGGFDNIYGGLWEDAYTQQQKPYPAYTSQMPVEQTQHQQMESYLPLTTDTYDSSPISYNSLYPQPSFDEQYSSSFYHDVPSYSNEPSPFFDHHRQILQTSPSLPTTPVTPTINTLSSSTYIMVPTTVHHMDGTSHIEYVPKMVSYFHPQSPLNLDPHNYLLEQATSNLSQFENVESDVAQICSDMESESEDDEPELVGMGLYDDTPRALIHSFNLPEMEAMGFLNRGTGRGLVLEESFDASEEDEEEEEMEEEEEEDEE